jgi:hypothetical protein
MRTDIQEQEMGKQGIEIVVDTVERTGEYVGVIFLADSTLTSCTPRVALDAGSDGFGDVTAYPKGVQLNFEFTKIKLASGEAILIKGDF